jgi:hypothetical protein
MAAAKKASGDEKHEDGERDDGEDGEGDARRHGVAAEGVGEISEARFEERGARERRGGGEPEGCATGEGGAFPEEAGERCPPTATGRAGGIGDGEAGAGGEDFENAGFGDLRLEFGREVDHVGGGEEECRGVEDFFGGKMEASAAGESQRRGGNEERRGLLGCGRGGKGEDNGGLFDKAAVGAEREDDGPLASGGAREFGGGLKGEREPDGAGGAGEAAEELWAAAGVLGGDFDLAGGWGEGDGEELPRAVGGRAGEGGLEGGGGGSREAEERKEGEEDVCEKTHRGIVTAKDATVPRDGVWRWGVRFDWQLRHSYSQPFLTPAKGE